MRHGWIAGWLLGLYLALSPQLARSAPPDALDLMARGDAGSLRAAIQQLANQGDPALVMLEALQDRRVKMDPASGRVYLELDGTWLNARSRSPETPPPSAEPAVINNVVRRALKSALARVRLRSADVQVRRQAAAELVDNPAQDLREDVAGALGRETDGAVRDALALTLAKIDLLTGSAEQKLDAIALIEERGDVDLLTDLERLATSDEEAGAVRDAARRAQSSVELKQSLIRIAGDLFYGISLGSVLMLAALGLAITFGLMGVINMAHGEMLMLGAYATYVVQSLLQSSAPGLAGWYLPIAVPVAFAFCTAVGILLERTVLRFLYGRPLETLLATWGISLTLIQTVRLTFGAQNVAVATPPWLSGGYEIMQGVVLPESRIAIVAFTVVVVGFVWWILNRTKLGLNVRAVTQNRQMAAAMGIRTAYVDMWTFGLGSGVAGLAGVALSQVGNVGPELGQGYIVDSFMVVVLGGVGKLAGTVAGALGIGVINKLLEPVSGAVFGKILVLAIIILFIQKRPQGLFALKGRAVEG